MERLYDKDFGITTGIYIRPDDPNDTERLYAIDKTGREYDLLKDYSFQTDVIVVDESKESTGTFKVKYSIDSSSHVIELMRREIGGNDTPVYKSSIDHAVKVRKAFYDSFYDTAEAIMNVYEEIYKMDFDQINELVHSISKNGLKNILITYSIPATDDVVAVFGELVYHKLDCVDTRINEVPNTYHVPTIHTDWYGTYESDCEKWYQYNDTFHPWVYIGPIHDYTDKCISDYHDDIINWLCNDGDIPDIISKFILTDAPAIIRKVNDMSIADIMNAIKRAYTGHIYINETESLYMIDKVVLFAEYIKTGTRIRNPELNLRAEGEDYNDIEVLETYDDTIECALAYINKTLNNAYTYLAFIDNEDIFEMLYPVLVGQIDDAWHEKYEEAFGRVINPNLKIRYGLIIE